MPEPITLIVGGVALYAFLTRRAGGPAQLPPAEQRAALQAAPSAATGSSSPISEIPSGALATNGSVASPVPMADAMTTPPPDVSRTVPLDLVAVLDNQTALAMRAYAALNPDDFQAFLSRYADRLVLRNDLMVEALTDPPAQGYELTPAMMVSLGSATYKVAQALNGVYVGRSIDVFGVSASVAGQIPGINPDLVSGLQAAAMGYRAITGIADIVTVVSAFPNVSFFQLGGMTTGAITAYPGLAALPIAGVLMAVGLVVDIGFTIIGDKPDLQKAVDVALDVASLAVLFIPVIGIVIAIVIQLVKFIIDLFGEDLFGGGMTHEQREVLETARYGENINPMYPELVAAYTPRELWRAIVAWGSGYCGGRHVVAMAVNLKLFAGDQLMIGGQPVVITQDTLLGFGDNEQPGGCYWLGAGYNNGLFAAISNDEQAWALAVFGPTNGVLAGAQAGIAEWRQVQFEQPVEQIIRARTLPMHDFIVKHRMSLDQIDQIALEYRAQPHLGELAAAFGWPTWQELFASTINDEWRAYTRSTTTGSLSDFAKSFGYPTMYAYRAAALAPFETLWAQATTLLAGLKSRKAMWESYAEQQAALEWQWQMQNVSVGGL